MRRPDPHPISSTLVFPEGFLVCLPAPFLLFISIEDFLRWRPLGHVDIVNSTNLFEKELQVVLLCKASKLRPVIQSDINKCLHSCILQTSEKILCVFLGKFDRTKLHVILLPHERMRYLLPEARMPHQEAVIRP